MIVIREGRHLESPTDEEIEYALAERAPQMRETVLALRELVQETVPGIHEAIDMTDHMFGYGAHQYGASGWGAVYIAAYTRWVNLGFMEGADLPDPEGLLEGTGKTMRHVKIRSLEELKQREAALVGLIEAATVKR
jgi:hypothetical protein